MSKTEIILPLIYAIGFVISRWMLYVEQEAEGREFTKLDRVMIVMFSLLSFVTVLLVLVTSWFKQVGATGYWNKTEKKHSQ